MATAAKDSFEDCVKKLEEIVEKLEEPEIPLEQSLKLFEEGITIARFCEKKLTEAEGKVEALMKSDDNFRKEPFES